MRKRNAYNKVGYADDPFRNSLGDVEMGYAPVTLNNQSGDQNDRDNSTEGADVFASSESEAPAFEDKTLVSKPTY